MVEAGRAPPGARWIDEGGRREFLDRAGKRRQPSPIRGPATRGRPVRFAITTANALRRPRRRCSGPTAGCKPRQNPPWRGSGRI
jgi:hypothetical protein